MTSNINKIFSPSTGIDIVFNINSLSPFSRGSIIYDFNLDKEEIIIAQPNIPFSKNTQFKELHLTTIITIKSRKHRVGIKCTDFKLIDKYKLNNKTTVPAILLNYKLPVIETNIRAAFRLSLGSKYTIQGKLLYNNVQYEIPNEITVKDISLVGFGIVIPRKNKNILRVLHAMKKNNGVKIEFSLINTDQTKPIGFMVLDAQIVRINHKHSETASFIGLKFLNVKANHETVLNKFIHNAQVDELKKLSRKNL